MRISACDPASAEALALVEDLSATLAAITGSSGKASFSADDVRLPRSMFIVAQGDDGALLGCGALRPLDGEVGGRVEVGEIKRMFARPGTQGVGAALLAHLEQAAREFGYQALWLETRVVNQRAVQFYLKHGYSQIPSYGRYVGRPEATCLGKLIR